MGGARLLRYVVRRLLQAVPVVLGVVVLNFLLLQLAPGDAATVLAGEAGGAPLEYIQQLRQRFGLDQPVLVQLAHYVKNILALDLGYSFRNASPVLPLILARLWPTLLLMGTALFRLRRRRRTARAAGRGLGAHLEGPRHFCGRDHRLCHAAVLDRPDADLVVLRQTRLAARPRGWRMPPPSTKGGSEWSTSRRHLMLPSITLSLFYIALYARLMRATMLDQRGLEYVTTARAKGLTEQQITLRHMLRNALLPVVTVAGVQVGSLLGGSVVVESVFAWPGLGQLAFQSLFARDLNLLLGIFFISSCLVVAVNILVDIIYLLLDPRIRVG